MTDGSGSGPKRLPLSTWIACGNAAFAFPVEGQLTPTFSTALPWHEVAVEHLTRTPYRVVTCGASTNVDPSVQSRRSVSPTSPTIPLRLASRQNWYWTVPSLHALTLDPDACSVTICPGPDSGGTGEAERTAEPLVQAGQASPENDALSTRRVSGLATAARLAASEPGTNWLFVTIETCSISIRLDSDDPAAIVATALFGDGAAAAVVRAGDGGGFGTITESAEKLWPDTLSIMGWRVEDPGLGVVFDRAIPPFIEAELEPAVADMCAQLKIAREDIDRFCCHPGGVKIIDAIETALHLPQGELNLEREVLHDYGNMSAPTVLFVLDRLLMQGLPERVMMTAFGPGFTCAGLLLEAPGLAA